jgi:KDO2-lipid IV(A) lauroyltransferase
MNKARKRKRPPWLEKALTCLLRMGIFMVRRLPFAWACRLARALGWLVGKVAGPGFLRVGEHLRMAFGADLPQGQVRALAVAFWRHVAQGAIEAIYLYRWKASDCALYMDLSELEQLDHLRKDGRGVLLVSGHLGSWEVGPYALALLGYPIHLLHNPGTVAPLFEYLKKERERSGMKVVSRFEHPWALKKVLDGGAWLCVACDLNAGRKGAFIPFFGHLASSYLAPAVLHQVTGCPIVVASTARLPGGRHRLHIWKVLTLRHGADPAPGPEEITLEIHQALEKAIRAYPEQWLWNYRRWRTRPKEEREQA